MRSSCAGFFAEEAIRITIRINGRCLPSPSGKGRVVVPREPVGPTLAITPWNFPLCLGARKIASALAADCTVPAKPAGEIPLTMPLLGRILVVAGVPHGVVSILQTTDAAGLTGPLIADTRLRKLTFTGSTGAGKTLLEKASQRVLRTSMELGGNAPLVVFADADLDAAVEGASAAKVRNNGEGCTVANRFHVDDAVRAEFNARLTERMRSMRVGPGHHNGVEVGPLIGEKQRASVRADAVGLVLGVLGLVLSVLGIATPTRADGSGRSLPDPSALVCMRTGLNGRLGCTLSSWCRHSPAQPREGGGPDPRRCRRPPGRAAR
ncbi:aldehyde dehydrogenase family protein [Streptomyces scabiei]|uniref:aldehyde dehydrogenase family protein n=1 Tax=Streptomyces scabiei TaxID=1930 RepID=UPI0036C9CF62